MIHSSTSDLLSQRLLAEYDPQKDSLAALSIELLAQQKSVWKDLAEGYQSLDAIKVREVRCRGFSVLLQYNPRRIVSTSAKVDDKSISDRRCFLCIENLPQAQKGILYFDRFLILCNPVPIFSRHYTISNVDHTAQAIEPFAMTFLNLARDLSPEFTVFYNGPKCGASAPDHMHFQASPTGAIPVEKDLAEEKRRGLVRTRGNVSCFMLQGYGRQVIVLESADPGELEAFCLKLFKVWRQKTRSTEEPMMNILCSYRQGIWRMIIFPRKKHRPDLYFKEGDERVLISPAAVDIGGLVVTPLEKDFQRVDAAIIEQIFQEVSLEEEKVEEMIEAVHRKS